jgi:hypothetical protein
MLYQHSSKSTWHQSAYDKIAPQIIETKRTHEFTTMTEENSSTINTNPQTSIILKPNIDFNTSQRLTNTLLHEKKNIFHGPKL